MRLVKFLLAIFFIFNYLPHFGQYQPVYRHLTVDEGLSASEVYHVFQDSKGYIWFATNNGVSRFDGYGFTNFDLISGLSDNTVFEIYEDYKHRIWFIPFSGNLSYFEDGAIKQYAYNSKIKKHLPNSRGPIKMSFYVDSLDNIYLGLKQFGLITINAEGIYTKLGDKFREADMVFQELPCGKILTSNPNNTSLKYDLIYFKDKTVSKFLFKDLFKENFIPLYSYAQKANDGSTYISANGHLIQIKEGKIVQHNHSIGSLIIWMFIDNNNNLWASSFEGGVFLFPNCNISSPPSTVLLKDFQVTSVLQDKEGSYWFSTLNDGVFYSPDYRINILSKENGLADNRVNAIFADNERVYIGYEMGFVDVVTNNGIKHFSASNKLVNTSYVRSIFGDTLNNRIWISAFSELGYFEKLNYRRALPDNSLYPRKVISSAKGEYWIGTAKGLKKIKDDKITYDSQDKDGFSAMVFSLVEEKNGVLWLNTINGLWKYSNESFEYYGEKNELLTRISHSMFINPVDSSLWIGTNGAGIVIYKKSGEISQISTNNGLISNSIHQLYYTNNKVWVATRQGLSLIPNINNDEILNFTIYDGLPSNEVTSVYSSENKVYIGTNKGLATIDIEKLSRNQNSPPTIITKLTVEGKMIPYNDSLIQLNYDQNTIDIGYVGLAYRNMGKLQYRHRMLGLDTNWAYTKSTSCLYSGLHSGEYVFQIQALNSNGIWNSIPTSLKLRIEPPFWERWWFIGMVTLFLAGVLYLVYLVRIKEIRRRNDLINNMNLYKQQSLRQQMNPHFIFNTLNSIQYYILERDTISSHKYLTKFARLMRMTLDNSLSPTVTLREEIDALRIYLELEALRLEGRFNFNIELDSNENILDIKIPTLLIQPFVENAIWHGIMLKPNKSGNVTICIKDMENIAICSIEDDGVGRKEAQRIQEQNSKIHKSRGYQITQQRIDLLNSMYKERFDIKVVDLFNDSNNPIGTRVIITIPKILGLIH